MGEPRGGYNNQMGFYQPNNTMKYRIKLAAILPIALLVTSCFLGESGSGASSDCTTGNREAAPSPQSGVCVYMYIRPDETYAYIGISNNLNRRWAEHTNDGRPFAHLNRCIDSCFSQRSSAEAREESLIERFCRSHNLYNTQHCDR
jgi:predicted GIY-YIG superfamily endonuclease